MLLRILISLGSLAIILLLLLINSTTPAAAGPFGVLGVFVCLYVILLVMMTLVLLGGSHLIARMLGRWAVRRPMSTIEVRRAYYIASVVALGPTMLIAMQSIGGVGVYEFILVVIFIVIATIYVIKRAD